MKKLTIIVFIMLFLLSNKVYSKMLPEIHNKLVNSFINLNNAWDFALKKNELFESSNKLNATKSWQKQGFSEHNGKGWYAKKVFIPGNWKGRKVELVSNGIDDEYSLYVNNNFIQHHGKYPKWSVYQWTTKTDISNFLKFGENNLIIIEVDDWGGAGGLTSDLFIKSHIPFTQVKHYLPTPVFDERPDLIRLYWKAWEIAWQRILAGTDENGFQSLFMDEGFNEQIFQWDSIFMTFFAKYGGQIFPVMESLDNFYSKQRPNGYIQRVYHEKNGKEVGVPTRKEPLVNPPLFAWAEWSYFKFSGDYKRLNRIFPFLKKYYSWLEKNLQGRGNDGLFYQTDLGSGMDNTPRQDSHLGSWVDSSMQMALFLGYLSKISSTLGLHSESDFYLNKNHDLKLKINRYLWHAEDGFYYDRTPYGRLTRVKHIGAFWSFLSNVSTKNQNKHLLQTLQNPNEFFTPHLFPTLAANEKEYASHGHYWRGGVWAPTNYMTIKGLNEINENEFAKNASLNHLNHLSAVFHSNSIDESKISPLEKDDTYNTLWECYAPEGSAPGTRWDGHYYSRQDFVGWTGLGPIALLIENVLGVDVDGRFRVVNWRPLNNTINGMQNIQIGKGLASFVYYPNKRSIIIESNINFTLRIIDSNNQLIKEYKIKSGKTVLDAPE